MRHSKPYLFCDHDLSKVLENQIIKMNSEIESMDDDRLLNTSVEDMISYLDEKYQVEIVTLDENGITVDQIEKDIVTNRFGEQYTRKGTSNKFYIPFTGDRDLFKCQASTFTHSPPVANVTNSELVLSFDSTNHNAEKIRKQFDRELTEIKRNLEWVNRDVQQFNSTVRQKATRIVNNRRERILANRNMASALGFPMRHRTDIPKTFSVPKIKRKPSVHPPSASTEPFNPEPALDNKEYEHILSVIDNMVLVMERSPQAFSNMGEENLRQHFLVQLNGHYEGQATGETFNFDGKTDILIRTEGRNIFIGECKFWRGPKSFSKTIDQILGYSSWRDTKSALLIFNRNKNLSTVLEKIPNLIKEHSNFKGFIKYDRESGWRAKFSHRDDKNRELILTVLVYEIPNSSKT